MYSRRLHRKTQKITVDHGEKPQYPHVECIRNAIEPLRNTPPTTHCYRRDIFMLCCHEEFFVESADVKCKNALLTMVKEHNIYNIYM
jgi:hypothetical protein